MKYAIPYKVVAYGEVIVDADSKEEARNIFDTFQCFELYDDSQKATATALRINPIKRGVKD